MKESDNIGIILLAAGASSRFNQNKLKIVFENESLLERTLKAATNSIAKEVIIVIGARQAENEKIISKASANAILNENWKNGIGSSIKCGLRKMLIKNPMLDAIIISVCDQPYLSSKIFDGLIKTFKKTNKKIIGSAYSDSIGVPVLYDKSLFIELQNIPDKYGAKKYIIEKASAEIIATFPFPNGEIDIDTAEDFRSLSLT